MTEANAIPLYIDDDGKIKKAERPISLELTSNSITALNKLQKELERENDAFAFFCLDSPIPYDTPAAMVNQLGGYFSYDWKEWRCGELKTVINYDPDPDDIHLVALLVGDLRRLSAVAAAGWQRLSIPSDFLLRPELVKSLYTHACERKFFLVHGTPGSGKTTLCRLLYNYILEQDEGAEVQIMTVWAKHGGDIAEDFSRARDVPSAFNYSDAMSQDGTRRWLLFDEGQETYDDPRLWNGLFKLSAHIPSPIIVLFALHGSARTGDRGVRTVCTPNAIKDAQRMTMWPSDNGASELGPIPGLYLLRSECDEMVELYKRNHPIPSITDDFKKWIFDVTIGHIGAIDSILYGLRMWDSRTTEISLDTFFGTGNLREMLDSCASGNAFARGLPTPTGISRPVNAPAIAYIRTLLQAPDGHLSYEDPSQVPDGAKDAHYLGWVVLCDSDASSITEVHFPSPFHRYQTSWLLDEHRELPAEFEGMESTRLLKCTIKPN